MNSTFRTSQNLYQVDKDTTRYKCTPDRQEPRISTVLKWVGKNRKILDVGCYNGLFSEEFKKIGNVVYGVDASTDAVEEAKNRGIKASVADLEDRLPFEDEFFDVIHAGEVIEHLYDTDTFISECARVLKKGGLLLISTPNTVSLPRRILYLMGKGKFFEASNTFSTEEFSVGHIRFFTKDLLRDFVQSFGFELLEFTSDYVNLPFFRSELLAKIKPTFGRSLIMKFIKIG